MNGGFPAPYNGWEKRRGFYGCMFMAGEKSDNAAIS